MNYVCISFIRQKKYSFFSVFSNSERTLVYLNVPWLRPLVLQIKWAKLKRNRDLWWNIPDGPFPLPFLSTTKPTYTGPVSKPGLRSVKQLINLTFNESVPSSQIKECVYLEIIQLIL